MLTPTDTLTGPLADAWPALVAWTRRLARGGLTEGLTLGRGRHTLQALHVHVLETDHMLVLAADRSGAWYAGRFEISTGAPVGHRWRALATPSEAQLSITTIESAPWGRDRLICLGTSRHGAWWVPLSRLLTPETSEAGVEDTRLQGSSEAEDEDASGSDGIFHTFDGLSTGAAEHLIHDSTGECLVAGGGGVLGCWSLASDGEPGAQPRLLWRVILDGPQLTGIALERHEAGDVLYVATSDGAIHRLHRDRPGAPFSRPGALSPHGETCLWTSMGESPRLLKPLSTFREAGFDFEHDPRGLVLVVGGRVVVITEETDRPRVHGRTIDPRIPITALRPLAQERWRGLWVALGDGSGRLLRSEEGFNDLRRLHPAELLDDEDLIFEATGRFEALVSLPHRQRSPEGPFDMGMMVGIIGREVQVMGFTAPQTLRGAAARLADQVAHRGRPEDLLKQLERLTLTGTHGPHDPQALAHLISAVGGRCNTEALWQRWVRWVWDLLAFVADAPGLIADVVRGVRAVMHHRPAQGAALVALERQIVRGVQDAGRLRRVHPRLMERVHLPTEDADERAIDLALLLSRRTDLLFQLQFAPEDRFGEVQAMIGLGSRVLVGTWRRGLWLIDERGRRAKLSGPPDAWGPVHTLHRHGERVILAFADGVLRHIHREALEAAWTTPGHRIEVEAFHHRPELRITVRALCALPGRRGDARLLSGDVSGRIHLEAEGRRRLLFDLGTTGLPTAHITDLCSGHVTYRPLNQPGGRRRRWPFVIAGTSTGHLHVFRWRSGPRPTLMLVHTVRAGVSPITCVRYSGAAHRLVVVSTAEGQVVGYPIGSTDEGQITEESSWRLQPAWSWQAGDTVRTIQVARLAPRRPPLIFAGAHDGHLHALDLSGRLLETYRLPGFKIERFVVSPPAPEDGDRVDARVVLCAFENEVRGMRLVSRRALLGDLQGLLDDAPDAAVRELTLTRWRAFALETGHLRHRFIRLSRRYPSADRHQITEATLDALAQAMRRSDHGPGPTGLVAALIRRLFQNSEPGALARGGPSPRAGMAAMVADADLYHRALTTLHTLELRWNTPGSPESRRVQLHWIRSMLRNVERPETLYRWFEVGEQVALKGDVPWARPGAIIDHFLSHGSELVQGKTLQYLERLFFRWPGVERRGLLLQAGPLCHRTRSLLVGALLRRLALGAEPVAVDDPQPMVLMCGRLLCMLVAWGRLDPLVLVQTARHHGTSEALFAVLAAQAQALTWSSGLRGLQGSQRFAERLQQGAALFDCAHRLSRVLRLKGDDVELVRCLAQMRHHALDTLAQDHPELDRGYLLALRRWLDRLIPMLEVHDLEALVDLPGTRLTPLPDMARPVAVELEHAAHGELPLPDLTVFDILTPCLQAVAHYRHQKWADFLEPPMTSLKHSDFHSVLTTWRAARARLGDRHRAGTIEGAVLDRLVERWDRIIGEEQQQVLLQDLMSIVEMHCLRTPAAIPDNGLEAVALLADEGRLTRAAFTNLFTRLVLFAEPQQAAFLRRDPEGRAVKGRVYAETQGMHPLEAPPQWLPASWLKPAEFSALDEHEITTELVRRSPQMIWEVTAIAGLDDTPGLFGYYIFGWAHHLTDDLAALFDEPEGLRRFRAHRLTRNILMEALVLRQASLEHRAMRGRLFSIVAHNLGAPLYHMRSDLKVLLDGFLEHDAPRRQEKYRELLHQARYMDGIIDGILSLSQRAVTVHHSTVDLAEVVHEVVRTQRKIARGRRIEIEYTPPVGVLRERCMLRTDGDKVYDILLNLVGNAVKYSEARGRIWVRLEPSSKGVSVRVEDEGIGVPLEERALVFEPFYRGQRALAEGKPGLGLGLYVARIYTEALEGRLQITGEPEEGTTVVLYLPRLVG
ncbi:MAG: sensor histidine kinase [Bradymonadia bacterium]